MLNYLKFATYQIFGFSCSIPKLNKIKKNPDNFTNKEIYDFLHKQAKKSLKLVNINLTINGKENIPNQPVLFICNHSSMLDSFILFASVDRPIGCVVADEPVWRSMPIVSSWAKLTKCVYINRQDNREVEFLPPIYKHIENPKVKTTILGESIRKEMIDSINKFNQNI